MYFNDDSIGLGKRLNFHKTTNISGFKILPYKWFLRLDDNLHRERHYRTFENVKSIYAPDGAELSDVLFVVFAERMRDVPEDLGDGYVISKDISSKIDMVGYILGLSTANEVGAFGLWPRTFYEVCVKRPDIMIIAQLLLSDKPHFWKEVWVTAKPGLLGKLRLG